MLKENKMFPFQIPKVLYENRYCNQEGFSILICGGKDKNKKVTNEVLELEIPSFKMNKFPPMVEPHFYFYLAIVKSHIIAIGDGFKFDKSLDEPAVFVEIYSEKNKKWTHKYVKMEKRSFYCVGSFMNKLYLLGGWIKSCVKSLSSCYIFDFNSSTLNKIADLNVAREFAACTVFEGKIVVTGGVNNWSQFNSVESYDFHENKWTYLPDMIEERCNHAAVSMGNKLFVIGGSKTTNCELFDSFSRKFTNINSEIFPILETWYYDAFSIGNNIVVFQEHPTETAVYSYDVDKEKWLNVQCDFTKNIFESSFVKYYT